MKVKALKSYGGQYALYEGDIAELPDNYVTRSLLVQGYVEETEDPIPEEESENKDVEEPEGPEESDLKADFETMSRPQLIEFAEAHGIEVDNKARKDDLIKVIKGA